MFNESQNLTKINRQRPHMFRYFIWQEASSGKSRQKIMKALKSTLFSNNDNDIITDLMAECLTASIIVPQSLHAVGSAEENVPSPTHLNALCFPFFCVREVEPFLVEKEDFSTSFLRQNLNNCELM